MYRDEFVTCGGVPLKEVRLVSFTTHNPEIFATLHAAQLKDIYVKMIPSNA